MRHEGADIEPRQEQGKQASEEDMPPLPSVKQFNVLADAAGLIKARDHHYAHRSHEDGCDNQAEDDAILPFAINEQPHDDI
ncbi:hypothetical protein EWH08_11580 [Sphingobium indicum]|uniref:Uncharacterized protein n=1 Tax=Sphingobium indicum TaxID=332055 RepID=A0A4V1WA60_9SPHN|nr:hypothetical protein EWH08_11580 [Sphingobium indicum]